MAAADNGAKPLQNAMKMAKLAIQLDGGNKHKVVSLYSVAATTTLRCKPQEIACQTCKQTEGGGWELLASYLSLQRVTCLG